MRLMGIHAVYIEVDEGNDIFLICCMACLWVTQKVPERVMAYGRPSMMERRSRCSAQSIHSNTSSGLA